MLLSLRESLNSFSLERIPEEPELASELDTHNLGESGEVESILNTKVR